MEEKEPLKKLITEAHTLLDRIVSRFEHIKEKDVIAKTKELRSAAENLNKQLKSIAINNKRYCSIDEVKLADDVVFQLSIYDDICEGYLKGI